MITTDLAPTGVLRASINLGNPVLAQGSVAEPAGVTVDIARELGARLGLPVELVVFDAARKSFEALVSGAADLCFLAVEPKRAEQVAFTVPYVAIEGVYAVPVDSPITGPSDVDRPGVRVGVNRGSAYDLYLTRTLEHAELVRGDDGLAEFRSGRLDAAAGVRQPMTAYVSAHPDLRLVEPRFMQIRQAAGVPRSRSADTVAYLDEVLEDLKANGFIAAALRRSGQSDSLVA